MGLEAYSDRIEKEIRSLQDFKDAYIKCKAFIDGNTVTFKITFNEKWFRNDVVFSLTPLPGCCGVLVSHGTKVDERWADQGLEPLLNKIKMLIARKYNYAMMLCTDIVGHNPLEEQILADNGWEVIRTFNNRFKTGNDVAMSAVDIK